MGKNCNKSKVEEAINALYKIIEFISALCLIGQVAIIAYAVVGRYIINKSPAWSEEISRLLMIWMALLTASLAVKDDTHVRISFLDKIFGKKGLFVRDLFFGICNLSFCGVLFWKGVMLAKQMARTKLPASGLSTCILYASVGIGGLCMGIMLVYKLGEKICHKK